jgi:hypothetical protein
MVSVLFVSHESNEKFRLLDILSGKGAFFWIYREIEARQKQSVSTVRKFSLVNYIFLFHHFPDSLALLNFLFIPLCLHNTLDCTK